jgi:hypothetical protein
MIEVRENSPEGIVMASCMLNEKGNSAIHNFDLPELRAIKNIFSVQRKKRGAA